MNLETLRQKIANQTTTIEVGGESYRVKKFGAIDGLAVNDLLSSMEMEGEGDGKIIKNHQDLIRLHALVLSKSIVDENGTKTLDSDEGRALLADLSDLVRLGNAVMDWCLPPQKKS